jgi:hypothetical protein
MLTTREKRASASNGFLYGLQFSPYTTAMPIRPYLDKHRFDAETTRLMGIAFETAIVALQQPYVIGEPVREAIAHKIIDLAKTGERDPERLCEGALEALRSADTPPLTDPNPPPPPA